MSWLSIIMAIITYLTSSKGNKENKGRAAALAAAAGLGTYYVTHETEWGRTNLGFLDGVAPDVDASSGTVDASNPSGGTTATKPVAITTGTTSTNGWDVLKNWGPTGVIGTTAAAAGLADSSTRKWVIFGGVALLAIVLLK